MSKKVLIISYYWPPSAGAGVQRWLKFSKYLPEFGITPVIYTPENPDFDLKDDTLCLDIHKDTLVYKAPIWEPYKIYRSLLPNKKSKSINSGLMSSKKKKTGLDALSFWVRGNLFIPDARCFWIKPSIKNVLNYIKKHNIETIISTGPPHSMHMIALGVKRKYPSVKWIADFRDPWTNIDFYHELKLSKWADKKHHRLEKEVISTADEVVTVTPSWAKELADIGGKKVHCVYNGYDDEDLLLAGEVSPPTDFFTIAHVGSINNDRNHPAFLEAIKQLLSEVPQFKEKLKLKLIGNNDPSFYEDLESCGLSDNTVKLGYCDHIQSIRNMKDSHLLYLPLNNVCSSKGIIPGKLYEYMASGRPILCVGHIGGDSELVINSCQAGTVVDFHDLGGIKREILSHFYNFLKGEYGTEVSDIPSVQKYSRKEQLRHFISLTAPK